MLAQCPVRSSTYDLAPRVPVVARPGLPWQDLGACAEPHGPRRGGGAIRVRATRGIAWAGRVGEAALDRGICEAAPAGLIALGFRMSEARAAGLTELELPMSEGAALGFTPSGWAPA